MAWNHCIWKLKSIARFVREIIYLLAKHLKLAWKTASNRCYIAEAASLNGQKPTNSIKIMNNRPLVGKSLQSTVKMVIDARNYAAAQHILFDICANIARTYAAIA